MFVSAYKGIFDKGYRRNWTMKIFTIDEVQDTKPITYLLKDKNNEELKDVFTKGRCDEMKKLKDKNCKK